MNDRLDIRPVGGPHGGQPVLFRRPAEPPRAAIVLVHGRYGSAEGMLPIAAALRLGGWLIAAPEAAGGTWYPQSFLAAVDENEPELTSALHTIDATVEALVEKGVEQQKIALLGFSQGACLALEYVARSDRPLGGVVGLSGGLIGPPGTEFTHSGLRENLRVFLGCSDIDPHIPVSRVYETEQVFRGLGADVATRIYPGMGHTISAEELYESRVLLRAIAGAAQSPS